MRYFQSELLPLRAGWGVQASYKPDRPLQVGGGHTPPLGTWLRSEEMAVRFRRPCSTAARSSPAAPAPATSFATPHLRWIRSEPVCVAPCGPLCARRFHAAVRADCEHLCFWSLLSDPIFASKHWRHAWEFSSFQSSTSRWCLRKKLEFMNYKRLGDCKINIKKKNIITIIITYCSSTKNIQRYLGPKTLNNWM